MTALAEGSPLPPFNLETDGGGRIATADLAGTPAVIYFYPKDDTPGCTKEAIAFTDLAGEFESLGVRIIGISPDNAAKHDKFIAKHGLRLTLAADPDNAASEAFGVWVEKSMYGKTYMGVERSTFLVDGSGNIARIWRKVKVAGHAEEVLAAARDLPR
ncbi:peroxiredoxin [Roseibium aestuarii]|uniref:thioredoxin-dependent peroxiredoxin n=1 Tax=Roseibium aestuarii TaxID=2600299 RepID=A0ABW4JRI0_9HYPH|nr:peroxiredoxin [Roseibium aestuarii]